MDTFIAEIHADKGLSQSSLKKYVVLVRKVLKEAKRDGAIEHIPTLPTIKRTKNPRPWFSPEQYARLLQTCRDLRDKPTREVRVRLRRTLRLRRPKEIWNEKSVIKIFW